MINVLNKTELFKNLNDDEISSILKCLNSKTKTYQRDEFIFLAGESKPAVGIVVYGKAQVIKENIQGDRLILRKLGAGDMFGETYAGMDIDKVPVSVSALEETQVVFFELKNILNTCKSVCSFHQTLILNLMKNIAKKSAMLNEQMSYLSHKTIRGRLEAYLFEQADKNRSASFSIPYNRRELAEYLCMDRSAMQRELGKMKTEGALSFNKNTFRVKL
ncbi:MAG: Crp/Fnr family transcriptional regulator [Eubacteriales bacterium]